MGMMAVNETWALVRYMEERFGIASALRDDLAASLERTHFKKGDFAFRRDIPCNSLLFLDQGTMRSFTTNSGGDEITYFLFFDQSFVCDFRSLVTREPSRFGIEALENCIAERLPAGRLAALLSRHQALHEFVRIILEGAYVGLDRRAESLLLLSATERYRAFIEEFGDRAQRIPQYVIASYLGLRPESLSRIRRKIRVRS